MLIKHHFWLIFLISVNSIAQNCVLNINGTITDDGTNIPLENATAYIKETKKGAAADSNGAFKLSGICQGEYHIVFGHLSCEPKEVFIEVNEKDLVLNLKLKHTAHELDDVLIYAPSKTISGQSKETISEQKILDNASKNLANLIESISGVSTLKNGTAIAKPVVHGNFGNRLTILNNGVAQNGQQWGNDHSPEIDPLVANKISVIKGVSALEYMGSNLGALVLVEPNSINKEPHLHGKSSYFFDSNGLGSGLNVQLQQYSKIGWKINATAKKSGDRKTKDFILKNTGNEELNLAFQLEKELSKNWNASLYFSSFNTRIAVFQGTQATNLTSLNEIITSPVQRFSDVDFSYSIEPPNQEVSHNYLKLKAKNYLDDNAFFEFTVAGQLNSRNEFDVRRAKFKGKPVLSLLNYNLFGEGKFQKQIGEGLVLKTGTQTNFINNSNQPGRGVSPLIPDYSLFQIGAFGIVKKQWFKNTVELGMRYDYSLQDVVRINQNNKSNIIVEADNYNNLNGSLGIKHRFSDHLTASYNLGYSSRNPGTNELYSFGVHQGVASFEEGDPKLKIEKAIKMTLEIEGDVNEVFTVKALGYYQRVNDYIFLEPLGFILTIRGALPSFKYSQVNAEIFGFDFSTKWNITHSLFSTAKYAFIRGFNLSQDNIAIINLPSNNLRFGIGYHFSKPVKLLGKAFENIEIEANSFHVFKQENISFDQELPLNKELTEFVPLPDGYSLFGISLASDIQLGKNRLRFTGKVDNLLNVAYRDYLNRQRYFADDIGINASLGLSLNF